MHLPHGLHLAYCTNIHRGENWQQTFESLQNYTLAVRDRVCPTDPFAIGLRLSDLASKELIEGDTLLQFQRWLEKNQCYIFTINGFPFGRFHEGRVKEQVYAPDWTTSARLEFTKRLFNILNELVPKGMEGSISTLPCSFKEFIHSEEQRKEIYRNLWKCVEHISKLSRKSGKTLNLGLEPEQLGLFETSQETVDFFDQLENDYPNDSRLRNHLGANYDTCHLAVEYEEVKEVIQRFQHCRIKISKIHLSSALKVKPTPKTRKALNSFANDIYLHQVIARYSDGRLTRYKDLDLALSDKKSFQAEEWRIHFHIPLYSPPTSLFDNTSSHVSELFSILRKPPQICSHLEMETYTWEVLPPELRSANVVDQLVREYEWCLQQLNENDLTI